MAGAARSSSTRRSPHPAEAVAVLAARHAEQAAVVSAVQQRIDVRPSSGVTAEEVPEVPTRGSGGPVRTAPSVSTSVLGRVTPTTQADA